MVKLKAFYEITRPLNVFIGGLSIFIGAFIAGSIQPIVKVLLAVVSGMFITAAANTINDYYDVAIDTVNKPYRPIPSGRVQRGEAWLYAIILFVVGCLLSVRINRIAILIAVCVSIVLYLYSAKLKRTVLWGNFTVSLISAFAFIYGGVAVSQLQNAIIPAVFSFFFHFGREIIKDIEDMEGDRADSAFTLPIRYGQKPALMISTVIFLILTGLTIMPYAMHIFGFIYLVVVIAGVDSVLIYTMISMWKNPDAANLGRLSTFLKMDMFVGLIAIYVGQF